MGTMSMNPRLTINTTHDDQFEIWINEAGRDLLVKQLLALNENNEHFHLGDWPGVEVPTRWTALSDDRHNAGHRKGSIQNRFVDRQHYPHVMDDTAGCDGRGGL
jgi:hypothetical protein